MKLEKPKFWKIDIFNILVSLASFVALFGFWGELKDVWRIVGIVGIFVLVLIVNTATYCWNVGKFYVEYKKLHDNNNALIETYKSNQMLLKQEENKNRMLSEFVSNTISLLVVYNDLSSDEQKMIKSQITERFISSLNGGNENEKKI